MATLDIVPLYQCLLRTHQNLFLLIPTTDSRTSLWLAQLVPLRTFYGKEYSAALFYFGVLQCQAIWKKLGDFLTCSKHNWSTVESPIRTQKSLSGISTFFHKIESLFTQTNGPFHRARNKSRTSIIALIFWFGWNHWGNWVSISLFQSLSNRSMFSSFNLSPIYKFHFPLNKWGYLLLNTKNRFVVSSVWLWTIVLDIFIHGGGGDLITDWLINQVYFTFQQKPSRCNL